MATAHAPAVERPGHGPDAAAPVGGGAADRTVPAPRTLRTLPGFAVVYGGAALLGRLTVIDGGDISLVWPAAGVGVLWLLARSGGGLPWLDVAALALVSFLVTALTGTAVPDAVVLGVASAVQAATFCVLLRRWCPRLWGGRARAGFLRVEELWWFLLVAIACSVASAPAVPAVLWLEGEALSWPLVLVWVVRNAVGILVVGTLGLTVGSFVRERRRAPARPPGARRLAPARLAEHVAAVFLPPAMYAVWFVALESLPLAFPLIALTVWTGSRLRTRFVVAHDTAMGVTAIVFTLAGIGPFAAVGDQVTQVLIAHLYVGLVTVIGLSLALSRDERDRLVRDLRGASDEAHTQAELLATIVDTLDEGVTVTDATGRVVLRNSRASELMGGVTSPTGTVATSAYYGLFRPDGSPLPDDELPHRRAFADGTARDVDLLVRNVGVPRGRILSFSSARLPADAGSGVVTVMRDVTTQREELTRAAQVQASLLPASLPDVPGYAVAARFSPAGSVGGDFYDWQPAFGGLVVTLADVMGKGTGAAILAATSRSVLRSFGPERDVAAALVAAEEAMEADLAGAGAFVTVFHARVDIVTGAVTYADAGHGLTLVVRADGGSERLPALGLPLGVDPGAPRRSGTAHLGSGDLLLMFSDAVLDAIGGTVADLGRVEAAVRGAFSADAAAQAVLTLVAEAGEQLDDLTVVAVRRDDVRDLLR
ncbi:SpoIIE family protein phosphatase [Cellulomonas sp. NPDC055163]